MPASPTAADASDTAAGDTYWEVTAEVPPESEELWGLFCYDQGALGAEWLEERDGWARVRYSFDRPVAEAPTAWPDAFAVAYPHAPPPRHVAALERPREPWDTAWRVHFEPLAVGERLVVCPPWQPSGDAAATASGRLAIVIDPGQGFGTGRHPSTALALELLERRLTGGEPPARMLDVGAGSGILALAARRLGVPTVWVADVDPVVLTEIEHNFALNALPPPQRLIHGGPDAVSGAFPLVVANIVTGVLVAHAGDLTRLTEPGGCLILSGILQSEAAALLEHYAALGMAPVEEARRDQWFACRLRHTHDPQGGSDGQR